MLPKFCSYKLFLLFYLFIVLIFTSSSKTSASNDWSMFLKDPVHSGYNIDEKKLLPPLEIKWSFSGYSFSSAAIYEDKVFIRSGGYLYSLDSLDGSVNWTHNYYQPTPHSSPAIFENNVYIGNRIGPNNSCTNCSLQALDLSTGLLKWEIKLPRGALDPTVVDGVVYFGSDDGYLRAANAFTGELVWTSTKLGNGVLSIPVVTQGRVFAGTDNGRLYALDASSGVILWSYSLGGLIFSSPSFSNGTLYIGSGTNKVYALDFLTGNPKWVFTEAHDSVWGSPAIADGKLFIQDLGGSIFSINAETGSLIWTYKTSAIPSSSYSSPAIANGVVYIGSQDRYLYAFDMEDGTPLWKFDTGGAITASPAILNGLLYIGSKSGNFYALGGEKPPLPSLSVPDIKQYSVPWNDDLYDHASAWAEIPTIERWGCALTSATMVLKYFGHIYVTPGVLNDWLSSQSDGYLRNGLLNWLAISRYTRLMDSPVSPTLLYNKLEAQDNNLIEELNHDRPVILKEPGHFIVVKSQLPSSFGINDPAYANRTSLEHYNNTYLSAASYQPTHTDLSYLLLAISSNFSIKVIDPEGKEIMGKFFSEEPLVEDGGGQGTSGEPLNIFQLQGPQNGKHKILVLGEGKYQLDSYLYNSEGNVTQNSLTGEIKSDHPDQYSIFWDSYPTIIQEVTLFSIINDIDTAFANGLFANNGLYTAIKKLLENSVKTLH